MSRDTDPNEPSAEPLASEPEIAEPVLRTVFEYSHDAICVVDVDSDSIIACNPAATDLFGYSRRELLSMPASELHPDDFEQFREFADRVIEEGAGWTDELTCYAKGGHEIPAEISATVCDVDGRTCLVSIIRDISDLRQHERQLERENRRLENFANIVSHDLRNPLNVMQLRLDQASREGDSEHFAPMESALERAFDIIDDTLMLVRQGSTVDEVEPVSLSTTLESCWSNVGTGKADLRLEGDCEFRADPDRLRHLLENLLQNAIEHGGDDVTVTVGALPDGFYVADSGPGVPDDERETVFDPGYTTSNDGTGLGLAIARQMAEAHGWEIALEESESGGARFEITGLENRGG
ncbi:MAG: PAS domain-containing sensor histidine kinase [Halovenus sp.]